MGRATKERGTEPRAAKLHTALAETATEGRGNASGLSHYRCGEPLLRGERGAAAASGLAVSDEGAMGKPPPPDPRHRLYNSRKRKRKEYDLKI